MWAAGPAGRGMVPNLPDSAPSAVLTWMSEPVWCHSIAVWPVVKPVMICWKLSLVTLGGTTWYLVNRSVNQRRASVAFCRSMAGWPLSSTIGEPNERMTSITMPSPPPAPRMPKPKRFLDGSVSLIAAFWKSSKVFGGARPASLNQAPPQYIQLTKAQLGTPEILPVTVAALQRSGGRDWRLSPEATLARQSVHPAT